MSDRIPSATRQAHFIHPTAVAVKSAPVSQVQLLDAAGPSLYTFESPAVRPVPVGHYQEMASKASAMTSKNGITASLSNTPLWQQFDALGTEMVITKSGRRIFPGFEVSVSGLDPDALYVMAIRVLPVDNYRHKYISNRWVPVGKADKTQPPSREHVHPESPKPGNFWIKQSVNFKKLKLTNNKKGNPDHIVLDSLHKYIPELHVIKLNENGDREETDSFQFPETKFYAVTAYQNDQVTQLKIDTNPFAKAFRDMPQTGEDGEYESWPPESDQRWTTSDYYASAANSQRMSYSYDESSPDLDIVQRWDPQGSKPFSPISPYTSHYRAPQQSHQACFFAGSESEENYQWERPAHQVVYNAPNYGSYHMHDAHYPTQTQMQQHRYHVLHSTGSSGYASDGLSPSPMATDFAGMQQQQQQQQRVAFAQHMSIGTVDYNQQLPRIETFARSEVTQHDGYSMKRENTLQTLASCQYATLQAPLATSTVYHSMSTPSVPASQQILGRANQQIVSHPISQTHDHSDDNKADLTHALAEIPDIDSASDILNWDLA